MNLDDAIKHCEEIAESKEKQIKNGDWEKDSLTERNCIKCASEHRQLAEWLRDYKRLKEQEPCKDAISRQAVLDMIEGFIADATSHGISARLDPYYVMDGIKDLPSVKPQESCDVPDTNVGDIISKQTVLDTISELNAISFYEAQEDSKECYYEIRQAIKDLSPVKQEPKTGHWIEHPEIKTSTPEYLMFYECSECGDKQCFCKSDIQKKHFCNNCGAKMD